MIIEPARAKLNLALHVRARRPDGYHELETLFAFVEAGDSVRIEAADVPAFRMRGRFATALAEEADNLVTRAAARFADIWGGGPWAITLDKELPVASGVGGGSADAAATLRGLARIQGVALDDPVLFACADALGSDVPACLLGVTALGKGRGEQLDPIKGLSGMPVLLVNPGVGVSTAEVFRRWDCVDRGPIGAGPVLDVALAGRNDLEAPAREIAPVIGDVVAALAAQPGVILARMSGSGATCFALFDSDVALADAARAIGSAHPGWWRCPTHLI